MNIVWVFLIISSVIVAGITDLALGNTDKMKALTDATVDSADLAVKIAISLIGIMSFWLGMMKIAEQAGLITLVSKMIQPIFTKLFPEIPKNHPAVGSMLMNISANMLGLSNAATPLGIKAMEDLQTLNKKKEIASNSMCTFLAINTAGFQLVPTTTISILAAAGATNPTVIVGSTLVATTFATICGVTSAKVLEKLSLFSPDKFENKDI